MEFHNEFQCAAAASHSRCDEQKACLFVPVFFLLPFLRLAFKLSRRLHRPLQKPTSLEGASAGLRADKFSLQNVNFCRALYWKCTGDAEVSLRAHRSSELLMKSHQMWKLVCSQVFPASARLSPNVHQTCMFQLFYSLFCCRWTKLGFYSGTRHIVCSPLSSNIVCANERQRGWIHFWFLKRCRLLSATDIHS